MESQCILAEMKVESTKFHKVVSCLQPNDSAIVRNILNPPTEQSYTTLQTSLCLQFADSEEQHFHDLISEMQLGQRKSSHLFLGMRSNSGNRITDNLLRSLFLSALHHIAYTIISNYKLESLAENTDVIIAAAGNSSPIHGINNEKQDLKTMLMDISSRLSRLETRK
ncbi:uncharacterized protein NPIL_147131 [Nephila pilipes]|uniref:DUF7041 domain-containing protein n=1 Tax=Nephila pilipes TaxID=299642 RepID=A0A8X6QNJ6_NEPPI|nr:uncharacterized protein NPIL_147131 [Nephila pilipes]